MPRKIAANPTPPPLPHNPFRKIWSAAAVILLLIVSVPMFVGAAQGQDVNEGSLLGTQTAALISALSNLESKVASLSDELRGLKEKMSGTQTTQSGGSYALSEGMPTCLTSCRDKLAFCLKSAPTSTGASPTGALDACRQQANSCINACRPRPAASVSCEDRCAVALGGCIVSAGSDAKKLTDCRLQNNRCILAACKGGTVDARAVQRVPDDLCRDQCDRDLAICRAVAKYDTQQLATCEQTARTCRERVCMASVSSSAPSIAPLAPGQAITVNCENACKTTYDACRSRAAGNETQLKACDADFGSCRAACLVLIGG